jgi:hypothetical protein
VFTVSGQGAWGITVGFRDADDSGFRGWGEALTHDGAGGRLDHRRKGWEVSNLSMSSPPHRTAQQGVGVNGRAECQGPSPRTIQGGTGC